MNTKRLIVIFIVISLSFTTLILNNSVIAQETRKIDIEESKENDYHLIEGVPYISTETGFDCEYASFAMLYQYLGIEYSYHDFFFLNGGAYTLATCPKLTGNNQYGENHYKLWPWTPPFSPYIDAGSYVSFWEQDIEFLSDIMGLDYNLTYKDEFVGEDAAWKEYWSRCKNYINQDIPVWTGIDGCCIPWWRGHMPLVQEFYDRGVPGVIQHIIVLVGYNETNGTVCYNDMVDANISKYGSEYTGGENETGEYLWMNLSSLKEGTCKGCPYYWPKYCMTLVLEKNESKQPKSKSGAFELAHERGLKKLQGYNKEVYDENYSIFYKKFGIDALYKFKRELKPRNLIPRTIVWRLMNRVMPGLSLFSRVKYGLFLISKDKQFASEALLENTDLCSFSKHDGLLLHNESQKWLELYNLTLELEDSSNNDRFFKGMIKTTTTSVKMIKIVNEIITIQKAYLN